MSDYNDRVEGKSAHLSVGLDIGSSSVHYAIVNECREVVYSPKPIMHFANTMGAVREAWRDITDRYSRESIKNTTFTGSGAESFKDFIDGMHYIYDSVAIPLGVEHTKPDVVYIFHIGAKDSYFFNLRTINGRKIIQEWRTGTKCGGGSGTLLEKQCRRLYEGEIQNPELEDTSIAKDNAHKEEKRIRNRRRLQDRLEQMFRRAEEDAEGSTEPCEFLARCGVVVQSDLIHKQNEGSSRKDNLAGLFRTVARNYKIDVLCSRQFDTTADETEAIVTGGIFANDIIIRNLQEFLGIKIERPEHYQNVAAIGAAIKGMEEKSSFVIDIEQIERAAAYSRKKRAFAPALSECLHKVREENHDLAEQIEENTKVVLGIDGGSTTTKGALVELDTGKILDKIYIKTHGSPEESLKRVLRYLSRHKETVIVIGVGATGSARKLYEKILVSKKKIEGYKKDKTTVIDRITDEITCHAMGVKWYNPEVDTIFEVGGQDMKFTCFADDGTVKEAKMNYSCQAGSGQTLENMADVINLNVEDSLQEAALSAKRVPIIDSTCGVFMEMDENRLIAEGFTREEIAAAIVRGTAASYYYKFVGGSGQAANRCSAQGGPALGKAFLAALAQVTDKKIEAYPHREMFGAWGQALDIIDNIKQLEQKGEKYATAFRGWDLVDMSFEKRKVSCKELLGDKSCGLRDCQLEVFSIEDDEIITGGFCPRGNSEASKKPKKNYVDVYHRIYEKHFRRQGILLQDIAGSYENELKGQTVGIKRSTATLGDKGIWSAALFKKLGFTPVVSPRTTKEIAQIGVDNSRTEFCIARKLATGHAALLNENPSVEYLFNPSFIELRTGSPPNLKYCIYTESEGYVLNDVLSLDKGKQINPILHFGDIELLVREIKNEFDRLGFDFTRRKIKDAIEHAEEAENEFRTDLYNEGDRFLERIEIENEKAYVGIGRDYVLLDPEASSNSGVMFSQIRGLDYIPQVFLEHKFNDLRLDEIVDNEFWIQSVKILKAGLFVAGHPNLFAIRMMNFACGPDSLKIYQEQKIQQAADKPMLVLLTDAQTNNAPFITRTEAHERVVNQSRQGSLRINELKRSTSRNSEERIWLIPYMGDASYIGAAGLRHFGVDSLVLPTNTQRGYEAARKHIYTEVCHPLKGVVGDAVGFLQEEIERKGRQYVESRYLVMLPTTSGPCRFGKYTELVREFLDCEGLDKIPVAGPSSVTDYFDIPLPKRLSLSEKIKMQKMLFKGIKASDLLDDIFLRFNPYADDKEQLQMMKNDRLKELERILENGAETSAIVKWGCETVSLFEATGLQNRHRFPLVLYIGEIYMRQHDPYTNFVIRMLEKSGLEVVRDPVADWLDYVNKINQRNAKTDLVLAMKSFDLKGVSKIAGGFAKSVYKGRFMSDIEEEIEAPFHEVLEGRHVLPKPIEMIETLEKNHEFHGNIEGESPLSTGIAYHFMHDLIGHVGDAYISGIFHVGPFTCMQEGVATAKIEAMAQQLSKRKPDLVFPVIHAFFGDSASANLDSEIAVFVEQCYQKREMLKEQYYQARPGVDRPPRKIDIVPVAHPDRRIESVTGAKNQ